MGDEWNIEKTKGKPTCEGLIFRCRVNTYFSNNRYVDQTSFNLLKRKSCPGCEECEWLLEILSEFYNNEVVMFDEVADGGLYRLTIVNTHIDHETGRVDDFDFKFVLE